MKARYFVLAVAMVGLALAGVASATTVKGYFTGVNPGEGVTITTIDGSSGGGGTTAGLYWFHRSDSPGVNGADISVPMTFSAFCIDVQQHIYGGHEFTWTPVNPLGMAPSPTPPGGTINQRQITDLAKLYSNYYKGNEASDWTGRQAAAFGIAVWEIVWESPATGVPAYDVNGGLFQISGLKTVEPSLAHDAQDILGSLGSLSDTKGYADRLLALVENYGNQDQMVVVGLGGGPAVPEPLTMLGVVAGIGGIGAYIRRRGTA